MNGQKKARPRLQNKQLDADIKEARKWVKHFDERGEHDTAWHQTLERLEAELKRVKKPKEELKDGS